MSGCGALVCDIGDELWVFTGLQIAELNESLKDLPGDETGDLGENILTFVHNQWVGATKLRTHFKSRLSKGCYKIL